jgi:putative ABC transport system ATP-binding protein
LADLTFYQGKPARPASAPKKSAHESVVGG